MHNRCARCSRRAQITDVSVRVLNNLHNASVSPYLILDTVCPGRSAKGVADGILYSRCQFPDFGYYYFSKSFICCWLLQRIWNISFDNSLKRTFAELISIWQLLFLLLCPPEIAGILFIIFLEVLVSTKLFVGSLPWSVNDEELKEKFEKHGNVVSAKVITDRDTRRSRGFGFVEMESSSDANNAIKALNNSEIDGRNIVVNEAKSRN